MAGFTDFLGAIAPIAGGLLGYAGASQQNAANRKEAARNRSFQERMSSTSHQREVVDLRAAGLNPILSANKGASSPGGSMATMVNKLAPAISSAMQVKRLQAELLNLAATTRATNANAQSTENDNVPGDIKAGLISSAWKGITSGFKLATSAPPNFAGRNNANAKGKPSEVQIKYDNDAYQKRLRKKAAENLKKNPKR